MALLNECMPGSIVHIYAWPCLFCSDLRVAWRGVACRRERAALSFQLATMLETPKYGSVYTDPILPTAPGATATTQGLPYSSMPSAPPSGSMQQYASADGGTMQPAEGGAQPGAQWQMAPQQGAMPMQFGGAPPSSAMMAAADAARAAQLAHDMAALRGLSESQIVDRLHANVVKEHCLYQLMDDLVFTKVRACVHVRAVWLAGTRARTLLRGAPYAGRCCQHVGISNTITCLEQVDCMFECARRVVLGGRV